MKMIAAGAAASTPDSPRAAARAAPPGGGEEDACCALQQCRIGANGDPPTVQECDLEFCDPTVDPNCPTAVGSCLAQDCGLGQPDGGEEDACCALQQCRNGANGDPPTVQECDFEFCDPTVDPNCPTAVGSCLAQDCGFGPPEGGECNAGQSCSSDSDCCPETETCNTDSGWCEAVRQCVPQFEACELDEDCCENEDGRPVFCDADGICAVADSQ
jgi:hypothetical protein